MTGDTQTIRLANREDAPAIRAIYAPFVTDSVASFETDLPTDDDMAARIAETVERFPWLVCVIDGDVAGYAYAGQHRSRAAYQWSVEVSVYVHADHRRSGVGRGLYESLFAALSLQGYRNAYAGITLPNPASVGLHESMGFEPVGVYHDVGYKDGAWQDVGWWRLALGEFPAEPDPPTPTADVRGSSAWERALSNGCGAIETDD